MSECEHVQFLVSGLPEKAQQSYPIYDCPWCVSDRQVLSSQANIEKVIEAFEKIIKFAERELKYEDPANSTNIIRTAKKTLFEIGEK